MSAFYDVGKYACKVTSQALTSASTGTPQFVLQFQVLAMVDTDDQLVKVRAQYTRTMYRTITEKTIPYFMEDLQSLGFEHGSYKFLDPNTPGFQNFAGLEIDMWCSHEEGQDGDDREKWGIARAKGPAAAKPLEAKPLAAAKVRELDNLFGKHLKGNAKPPAEKQTITPGDVGKLPADVDLNRRLAEPPAPPRSAPQSDWTPDDSDVPF